MKNYTCPAFTTYPRTYPIRISNQKSIKAAFANANQASCFLSHLFIILRHFRLIQANARSTCHLDDLILKNSLTEALAGFVMAEFPLLLHGIRGRIL